MVQRSVDQAAGAPWAYSHEPEVCKYHRPVYHIGQDESVYKAFARERNEWVIRGVRGLRKKLKDRGRWCPHSRTSSVASVL